MGTILNPPDPEIRQCWLQRCVLVYSSFCLSQHSLDKDMHCTWVCSVNCVVSAGEELFVFALCVKDQLTNKNGTLMPGVQKWKEFKNSLGIFLWADLIDCWGVTCWTISWLGPVYLPGDFAGCPGNYIEIWYRISCKMPMFTCVRGPNTHDPSHCQIWHDMSEIIAKILVLHFVSFFFFPSIFIIWFDLGYLKPTLTSFLDVHNVLIWLYLKMVAKICS